MITAFFESFGGLAIGFLGRPSRAVSAAPVLPRAAALPVRPAPAFSAKIPLTSAKS